MTEQPGTWECPNCHQVFAPGTKKYDQCGKSGHELLWDMTRHMEIQVTRNGKGERYRITGITGTSVLHADPLDKTEPAPPPACVYLLYKHKMASPSHLEGVYASQEKAKDSAHYWARSERMSWAELLEKEMSWEDSDQPLEWRPMMTADCRNWTSSVCARAGTTTFVIDVREVQDGPLRHTGPDRDQP